MCVGQGVPLQGRSGGANQAEKERPERGEAEVWHVPAGLSSTHKHAQRALTHAILCASGLQNKNKNTTVTVRYTTAPQPPPPTVMTCALSEAGVV